MTNDPKLILSQQAGDPLYAANTFLLFSEVKVEVIDDPKPGSVLYFKRHRRQLTALYIGNWSRSWSGPKRYYGNWSRNWSRPHMLAKYFTTNRPLTRQPEHELEERYLKLLKHCLYNLPLRPC